MSEKENKKYLPAIKAGFDRQAAGQDAVFMVKSAPFIPLKYRNFA